MQESRRQLLLNISINRPPASCLIDSTRFRGNSFRPLTPFHHFSLSARQDQDVEPLDKTCNLCEFYLSAVHFVENFVDQRIARNFGIDNAREKLKNAENFRFGNFDRIVRNSRNFQSLVFALRRYCFRKYRNNKFLYVRAGRSKIFTYVKWSKWCGDMIRAKFK